MDFPLRCDSLYLSLVAGGWRISTLHKNISASDAARATHSRSSRAKTAEALPPACFRVACHVITIGAAGIIFVYAVCHGRSSFVLDIQEQVCAPCLSWREKAMLLQPAVVLKPRVRTSKSSFAITLRRGPCRDLSVLIPYTRRWCTKISVSRSIWGFVIIMRSHLAVAARKMMISWLEDDRSSDNDDRLSVAQQPTPERLFPRVPCRVTLTTRLSAIQG